MTKSIEVKLPPDGIPQDVWDAAQACIKGVGWHANSIFIGAARGIMAERERCAKQAEELANDRDQGGEIWVARRIADAIRKPTP